MGELQLLDGLCDPIGLRELLGEHHTDVVLLRDEVRQFRQRAEGLIQIPGSLHPSRVLEEVLTRLGAEPLLREAAPEGVISGSPAR